MPATQAEAIELSVGLLRASIAIRSDSGSVSMECTEPERGSSGEGERAEPNAELHRVDGVEMSSSLEFLTLSIDNLHGLMACTVDRREAMLRLRRLVSRHLASLSSAILA